MSTIKLSWGTGIAILYTGFVLLIGTLVVGSMRQNYDLVSSDYYEQELKYQDVIDAGENQALLSAPVELRSIKDDLILSFPQEFVGKAISGSINFYAPEAASRDRSFAIRTEGNQMVISLSDITPGAYKARIDWKVEGKAYYQETSIMLKQ